MRKMTVIVLIIFIMIGLMAGIFSSLIGIGGIIIIILSLVFLPGMNRYEAQGISLAVICRPRWHIRCMQLLQSRSAKLEICTYYCFCFPHW